MKANNREKKFDIGVIGLGTMGRNLALNIIDHGFTVIGFDSDESKIRSEAILKINSAKFEATSELELFVDQLRQPRSILLLVPAGAVVDKVISEILPFLAPKDLVIDGGNSHFRETDIREKSLAKKGIYFLGMGVSGGESGARLGPSLMPGGNQIAYDRVEPILKAIAAKVDGEPCVSHLGPGSSGHYVKMVHNGIEYGLMQLIAETYTLMKTALNLSDDECHKVFREWNTNETSSYLLEITAQIFLKGDDKTDHRLIDVIRDVARQKGTGMWACQEAMELQVPTPTIDAAVAARDLSAYELDRRAAHLTLEGPRIDLSIENKSSLNQMRNAFYVCSIITFAQGMALLQKASSRYHYSLNLEAVARLWRGGCIIRSAILEPILWAYHQSAQLTNLLLDPYLGEKVSQHQTSLRATVRLSASLGISVPAMMASLSYYDGLRSAWLPANLIQAQRDYFGAHTYERVDEVGQFHSNWENP